MVLFFFEHKTKMFYCRLATPALSRTTVPPSPPKARAKPFSLWSFCVSQQLLCLHVEDFTEHNTPKAKLKQR
jgi:hypothetical protein